MLCVSTHDRGHKLTNPSVVTLLSRCNEKYELSLSSGSDEGPDKCEFIWETKIASFVTPTYANRYMYVQEKAIQFPDDLKQHFNR